MKTKWHTVKTVPKSIQKSLETGLRLGLGLWYLTHFHKYFSYIVAVSFLGGGNRSTRENYQPIASHWQTLSHTVVSITSRMSGNGTENVSVDRHLLHVGNKSSIYCDEKSHNMWPPYLHPYTITLHCGNHTVHYFLTFVPYLVNFITGITIL